LIITLVKRPLICILLHGSLYDARYMLRVCVCVCVGAVAGLIIAPPPATKE
jgi:hypothetical protein